MELQFEQEPHIVIDPDADEAVTQRLQLFDKLAHERPGELQYELFALGELATAHTIDRSEIGERKTSLKRLPKELLIELFTQRYDDNFDYDTATLAALNKDEVFGNLLQTLKQANVSRRNLETKDPDRLGSADARAEQSRDAVRRYRVAFYLRRLIHFDETNSRQISNEPELRSVS